MKKVLIVTMILVLGAVVTNAQTPDWLWAKSAGGSDYDWAYSVTFDGSGNIFVAGGFKSSTITFGSFTLTNANAGYYDMFLVKYDSQGNVLWAKSAGGNSDDEATSVSADASGNIFVAGHFTSPTITFSSFTLTNTNTGYDDMFLVKYDNAGNVLWAKSAGGSSSDWARSVTADGSGNIFVAGKFGSSTITFGSFTLTNAYAYSYDMFLVKYDNAGNVLWAKSASGSASDGGRSVTADASGNIFVSGWFQSSTITFNSFTLTNAGSEDIFLVKYAPNGNVLWAKSAGGSSWDEATSVTADGSGNIFVSGEFGSSTITFGSFTLTNADSNSFDMFLVKYDNAGNVLWAKSAGGSDMDVAYSVTSDGSGNIIMDGGFASSNISFDSFTLTNDGSVDMFIVKYDNSGNVLWAKSTGGSSYDYATYVTADTSGNIVVAGYFYSSTITFGSITLTNADNSGNTSDMFIASLSSITGIESIENKDALFVYPNPSNGKFTVAVGNFLPSGGLGWALEIYNVLGEKVYSSIINSQSSIINLDVPAGIYLVQVKAGEKQLYKKLVIE